MEQAKQKLRKNTCRELNKKKGRTERKQLERYAHVTIFEVVTMTTVEQKKGESVKR